MSVISPFPVFALNVIVYVIGDQTANNTISSPSTAVILSTTSFARSIEPVPSAFNVQPTKLYPTTANFNMLASLIVTSAVYL